MEQCMICGQYAERVTDDHIPAKGLFGKPRPADLIVVRSCQACNRGTSADDEYFRLIAVDWDASRMADPVGVASAIIRSVEKAEAAGVRRLVLGSISRVLIQTP